MDPSSSWPSGRYNLLHQQNTGGVFKDAHHFTINNPLMYDITYNGETCKIVMKEFAAHTIEGAEFDSSGRFPPPRCHPGTRKRIVERMQSRFHNPCHTKKMLWLVGPAGVGKSAIMQTLAELASQSMHIATLFFSAPNGRDNPSQVVTTLAYQIAVQYPPYREFVCAKIQNDPKLPQKSITALFAELIVEPFVKRRIYQSSSHFLILLDGLDECKGEREQCMILGIISYFTMTYPNAPLFWVISSRPEAHITTFLSRAKVSSSYEKEEVSITSDEACRDVECFLRIELERIRAAYPATSLYPQWPLESHFVKLAAATKGFFAFGAAVTRFIGEPTYGNPVSKLQVILDIVDNTSLGQPDTGATQPMAQLDALYDYVISQVPPGAWPDTRNLLSYLVYGRPIIPTFAFLCEWLGLTPDAAYGAVHRLHSVLNVPPPHRVAQAPITFYHKSFKDYLSSPGRSGTLALTRIEEEQRNVQRALRLLKDVPRFESPATAGPSMYIVLLWSCHEYADSPVRSALYQRASSEMCRLHGSLTDLSLSSVTHALKVMNVCQYSKDLLEVLFDNNLHSVLRLREHGAVQYIPFEEVDLNKVKNQNYRHHRSQRKCGSKLRDAEESWEYSGMGRHVQELITYLEDAKTRSPGDFTTAFIGNEGYGWIQCKTTVLIKGEMHERVYTFRYDFPTPTPRCDGGMRGCPGAIESRAPTVLETLLW